MARPGIDPVFERIVAERPALMRWYRRRRRDLPWRRTRDPYAIWVSEIMLQQTRVEVVIPYYSRFLDRFPDLESLAAADEDDVLAAWSGLGYYRRARALHEGVRIVADRHRGRVPDDPDTLMELPGIGRYTAGAIASIAYDRPAPILDGNVRRVLTRLLGRHAGPGDRDAPGDRRLWTLASELVQCSSPRDLNQALMELGATVCRPRQPDCGTCPLRPCCDAVASGTPERWPEPRRRRPTLDVRVVVALVRRGSRVLLERPGPESPLRGRWDLPALELEPDGDPGTTISARFRERYGISLAIRPVARVLSHGIMHRRLRLEVHPARMTRGRTAGRSDVVWVEPEAIDDVAVSGATRKVLRSVDLTDPRS